jgi:hypothetical protein
VNHVYLIGSVYMSKLAFLRMQALFYLLCNYLQWRRRLKSGLEECTEP